LICAVPNMTVGIIILSGEYTFLFLVLWIPLYLFTHIS
jgi:hypothetical protein